jgi:uncharacterized membrane protein YgcG
MNYRNISTGEIISEEHYMLLPLNLRRNYTSTFSSVTHYVNESNDYSLMSVVEDVIITDTIIDTFDSSNDYSSPSYDSPSSDDSPSFGGGDFGGGGAGSDW